MEKTRNRKRVSVVRLYAELFEESIILVFLELKLAFIEIKRHVHSAENGVVLMAVGAGLLLLGILTCIGTAVAALAVFLPVWLAALAVASALTFFGIAFLFSGLGKMKDFSLIPTETLERIQDISQKLKKVSARHEAQHAATHAAMHEGTAGRTTLERARRWLGHRQAPQ